MFTRLKRELAFTLKSQNTEVCRPAPGFCGPVPTVNAARAFVDLVWRPCYAGLQPPVTKRIGTAASGKTWMMLPPSWQAGLQLEVPGRIATAARREALCEEKNWVAEATKQVAGRQLRAEAGQRRACPEKK